MSHISGIDRSQLSLLPSAVDDYVGPDNPVRFIDAFVDSLNLASAGFRRVTPAATGRPGYDPADLLKLYIYGYLNRVRSSRRLEVEARRNIEVIWLLCRLAPDFKTIADFRRDNRAAFRQVFRQFVVLCRELDLYGRELIAIDGTRIKAVNAKTRNFTHGKMDHAMAEVDERLALYMDELDRADKDDDGSLRSGQATRLQEKIARLNERRARLDSYRAELEAIGEKQISLTDPDAKGMPASCRVDVGYTVQIAVDTKHHLIAEQQVHPEVNDLGFLEETASAAMANLDVETIEAVADRGYFRIEDIEACEAAGITTYVPKPERGPAKREGHFAKERFAYDAEANELICPGGARLKVRRQRKLREGAKATDYYNPSACKVCALKARCTDKSFRLVMRYENEEVLERTAARLAARPEVMDIRRNSVEHPFGSIKQWMNQGSFLMRRVDNVRGEFSLTALAYNIRRAINLVGIPALLASVRA